MVLIIFLDHPQLVQIIFVPPNPLGQNIDFAHLLYEFAHTIIQNFEFFMQLRILQVESAVLLRKNDVVLGIFVSSRTGQHYALFDWVYLRQKVWLATYVLAVKLIVPTLHTFLNFSVLTNQILLLQPYFFRFVFITDKSLF